MKNKTHLSFEERLDIQAGIKANKNISEIALYLGKSVSTISREIKKHRYLKPTSMKQSFNSIDEHICPKLKKSPFVCNNCHEFKICRYHKVLYAAKQANIEYTSLLSNCRKGSNFSPELLEKLSNSFNERLKKKQPISHIFNSLKDEIPFSRKTFYNLIDSNELAIMSIKLPRRVRYSKRKVKKQYTIPDVKVGRTYEDYKNYIAANPTIHTTQMDLVEGKKGTGFILTLYLVEFNFLLGFIIYNKKAETIASIHTELYKLLGKKDYCELFPILLTDNGSEFSNIDSIELTEIGFKKTNVFYCNPYASYEKGSIENKHSMLRIVYPKGYDFTTITQDELDKVISNINSCNLDNCNPYEQFTKYFGEKIAKKLRVTPIPENEVTLSINYMY